MSPGLPPGTHPGRKTTANARAAAARHERTFSKTPVTLRVTHRITPSNTILDLLTQHVQFGSGDTIRIDEGRMIADNGGRTAGDLPRRDLVNR
jgi:hypothetical protein